MNRKNHFIFLFMIILFYSNFGFTQIDTLTIVSYSLADFPSASSAIDLTPHFARIFKEIKPDIITFQQITNESAITILKTALKSGTNTEHHNAEYIDGADSDNLLFFNPEKITLISQKKISTSLRDINRYELFPANFPDFPPFYIYSLHLKAGTSKAEQSQRRAEMKKLQGDIGIYIPHPMCRQRDIF